MTKFIINEGLAPAPELTVEADYYGESGSFTNFYNADGDPVQAVRTDSVFTIRTA